MTDEPQITAPRWTLANVNAIPGTGRKSHGHWFRYPRNISVKRAIMAMVDSLRGVRVPPDSYDDISIAAHGDRNWKRHRLTKWKEPKTKAQKQTDRSDFNMDPW